MPSRLALCGNQGKLMTRPTKDIESELLWYLEFSENQLLQALTNLAERAPRSEMKARLLAHIYEVENLIERRKCLFHNLNGSAGAPSELNR